MKVPSLQVTVVFLALSFSNSLALNQVKGIELYNRTQYDSAIVYLTLDLGSSEPEQEGLARYLLAECHYNIALEQPNPAKARLLLQKAWHEFGIASRHQGLESVYPEYFLFAKYKLGWCSFRLAELEESPIDLLDRAYAEFRNSYQSSPDSLKPVSLYMAGESKRLQITFKTYLLQDRGYHRKSYNDITGSYADLTQLYDNLGNLLSHSRSDKLRRLKALLLLKRQQIKYDISKLYSTTESEQFDSIDGVKKKASVKETALAYLDSIHYDGLDTFSELKLESVISYLSLMNNLQRYFLNRDAQTHDSLLRKLNNRSMAGEFQAERLFRLANLYHAHPDLQSKEFINLASSFYEAAGALPESNYWLGYLLMIQNKKRQAEDYLQKYIDLTRERKSPRSRSNYLLEDARYRTFLLDFEAHYLSDNWAALKRLAQQIKTFSAKSQVVGNRKKRLNVLINCSLESKASQIWTQVLTGSEAEKIEQAFNAVQFILPRAALSIGLVRERYLFLLNRLLEVTLSRRRNETYFFQGIATSLEAEIQATPKEKIATFMKAAMILGNVQPSFHLKSEADYIRAKCLFFANESEQAERLLKHLVNENEYLRALFYLGEIYRLNKNGLAAIRCYETIVRKLRNSPHSHNRFWLENSQAALTSVVEEGNLEVLTGLKIDGVEYQPALTNNGLFYEKLADEILLTEKYRNESIDWLIKFGLPAKQFYPSRYRLKYSHFATENTFAWAPFEINEVRGALTSSLNLMVMTDRDVRVKVRLDEKLLETTGDNLYFESSIPFNSKHVIRAEHPEYYSYQLTYQFDKPGENRLEVALSEKLKLKTVKTAANILTETTYPLGNRWDANFVMNAIPIQDENSKLLADFKQDYNLRDMAIDKVGNRILAVSSQENNIRIYSNDRFGRRIGSIELSPMTSIGSQEGITIDSEGRIYIADWANHRILQIDVNGQILARLGKFGTNAPDDLETQIRLVFPTRVSVLEDTRGIKINGERYFREPFLCVADQNGIHICRLDGAYLGTLVAPSTAFPSASFYAFAIAGYGHAVKLRLVNRKGALKGKLFDFVQK